MLGKLAYRNAKRSVKDYLIYLITVSLAFSLIFAFHLVASSEAVTKLSSGMDFFQSIMIFVNCIIVFVVCFLINYTTKFMFQKRSKELGTYMLLGIKKKEIAKLFVLENLLLGFLSLLLSIPLGFFLSQFISIVIVNIFHIPHVVFVSFNFISIFTLLVYFVVIYVLVLFKISGRIKKMTIHRLIYLDQQNEKKMFYNRKNRNTTFFVSLLIGIASLYLWDSRFDLEVFNDESTLYYLLFGIIGIIISIYGICVSTSDMLLTVLLKSKTKQFQSDNLFVIRTYASKARTMGFTMGTLSMLILLSLLSMNISSLTKGMYDYLLDVETPYDVSIFDDKTVIDDYRKVIDEDYTINDQLQYDIYKEPSNQVQPYVDEFRDFDSVIKLSDYNKLLTMRGMESVALEKDQYRIVTGKDSSYLFDDNKSIQEITLSNGNKSRLKGVDIHSYWYTINNQSRYVIVLPDYNVMNLETVESHLIIDTKEDTKASLEKKIWKDMSYHLCEVNGDHQSCAKYKIRVRGAAIEVSNSMIAIMASVCLYIAFIFISVVGTILAIQSLSDSTKYKYRYVTLQKLGVSTTSLYKTIRKQLFILFGLPVVYPVIAGLCFTTSMNTIYHLYLDNPYVYVVYFISSLLVFLAVYTIYWVATYIGFKRNINE